MLVDEATKYKALELFEAGIHKEHMGKMSDAVDYYRKAFKSYDKVDKLYREKLINSKNHAPVDITMALSELRIQRSEAEQAQQAEESLDETEDGDTFCAILELLDDHCLLYLMSFLAHVEPPSWVSLSLTCTRLAHIGFESSLIWKNLALDAYKKSYPGTTERDLDAIRSSEYNKSWKQMYFKRPFLKFQGLYISICTYLREGSAADSLSWTNPIHMITYYRYVRFFPNGTCYRVLTVNEPPEIVPSFKNNYKKIKDCYLAYWSLTDDGRLTIQGEGAWKDRQFVQEFQIASTKGHKHSLLKWIRSYIIDIDGVEHEISLRNEKGFRFHGVRDMV